MGSEAGCIDVSIRVKERYFRLLGCVRRGPIAQCHGEHRQTRSTADLFFSLPARNLSNDSCHKK